MVQDNECQIPQVVPVRREDYFHVETHVIHNFG